MKVAIYQMTVGALRNRYDDAGRRLVDEAAGIVLRGVAENRYVYSGRVKFDDPMIGEGDARQHDWAVAMEKAFYATQNDCAETGRWTGNESTIYSAAERQRSTMVGDIFVYGEDAWVVASCGFKKLPAPVGKALVEGAKPGNAMDDM
jgi:hypothetical protein